MRPLTRTMAGAFAYLVVFAVLAGPWWRHMRDAIPADDVPQDGWLILWVLDWCRHALATAPTWLFDAPVNYPAPAQLAGSEHLLSAQLSRRASARRARSCGASTRSSRGGRPYTVRYELALRAGAGDAPVASRTVELRRDLPAAEELAQTEAVRAPAESGDYLLEVTLRQIDGPDLGGPDNPARVPVRVTAP
jgi:hypothetical protein